MSNLELQRKAENLIKDKKWDFYLIDLFLHLRHLSSTIKKNVYSGYTKVSFDVIEESFKDINFQIGGFNNITSEDYLQSVVLYIESKLVMHIQYKLENSAEWFETHKYKIVSVEEFHNDSKINELLVGCHKSFEQKILNDKHQQRIANDMRYKNKFTFD